MKKILVFLVLLILPSIVNARNYLNYDWSIRQSEAANYLYYDETLEDSDGYVTISINEYNLGVMSKISKDGKEIIWQLDNSFGLYYGLTMDDKYYYALFIGTVDEFTNQLYVARVDKKTGEINNDYVWLEEDDTIYDGEIYYYDNSIYVIARGYKSYDDWGAKNVFTIDADSFTVLDNRLYEQVSKEEIDEVTAGHELYISDEEWYDIYPEEYDSIIFSNQFNSDDYYYGVGEACKDDSCFGFLLKIDHDKNVVWLRKNLTYYYFDASSPANDYVAVLAYKDDTHVGESSRNADKVESYLLVYDENGEVVETHDISKEIGVKNANMSHIISYGKYLLAQSFGYDEDGNYNSYLIKYNQYYNIKTDVTGNGQIKVKDEAYEGEKVSFESIPLGSSELVSLEVILPDNTKLDFTDGSFVMPDSDVVIKAVFKSDNLYCTEENGQYYDKSGNTVSKESYFEDCGLVENPKTGLFLSPILLLILIISMVFIRRKNFVNRL